MKAKDLEVGMCVAIKDGYIKRAYVLEMGTRYNRDSKSVAVAVAMRPFDRHPLNEQDFRHACFEHAIDHGYQNKEQLDSIHNQPNSGLKMRC